MTDPNPCFNPPWYLRNRHLQSIIASIKLRRPLVQKRAATLLKASEEVIIPCGKGVRLQGQVAARPEGGRGLVLLLHGWEGSCDSMYLLSAAGRLFAEGFSVFRLNFRDHGTSHHLNQKPFNSCRLDEVLEAALFVQKEYGGLRPLSLCGFSLGGNFALRVAAHALERKLNLGRVVAVCPVIHPPATMDSLEQALFVYRKYFIRKWKRSLMKKQKLFPSLYDFRDPTIFRSLRKISDYLVEHYTNFPDSAAYLNGYSLEGDLLRRIRVPAHIIAAADDPVIPIADLGRLAANEFLGIHVTPYGGHCGFIKGLSLNSWIDDILPMLLDGSRKGNKVLCAKQAAA